MARFFRTGILLFVFLCGFFLLAFFLLRVKVSGYSPGIVGSNNVEEDLSEQKEKCKSECECSRVARVREVVQDVALKHGFVLQECSSDKGVYLLKKDSFPCETELFVVCYPDSFFQENNIICTPRIFWEKRGWVWSSFSNIEHAHGRVLGVGLRGQEIMP